MYTTNAAKADTIISTNANVSNSVCAGLAHGSNAWFSAINNNDALYPNNNSIFHFLRQIEVYGIWKSNHYNRQSFAKFVTYFSQLTAIHPILSCRVFAFSSDKHCSQNRHTKIQEETCAKYIIAVLESSPNDLNIEMSVFLVNATFDVLKYTLAASIFVHFYRKLRSCLLLVNFHAN